MFFNQLKYSKPFWIAFLFFCLFVSDNRLQAHSGGLNASGCHAGSKPYHCHRDSSEMRGNRLKCKNGSRYVHCQQKPKKYPDGSEGGIYAAAVADEFALKCQTMKVDGRSESKPVWTAVVSLSSRVIIWSSVVGLLKYESKIPATVGQSTINGTLNCEGTSCHSEMLSIDRYSGNFVYQNNIGVVFTGSCQKSSNKKLF